MKLEWDGHVGPATIVSVLGSLGVLVMMGMAWSSQAAKTDAAALIASEARTAAKEVADQSARRDIRVSAQAERLGKIETSVSFIVPALQRIESKLDAVAK